jgi:hypothetical protein
MPNLVPHLHRAGADGAVNRAPEHPFDTLGLLALALTDFDLDSLGVGGTVRSLVEEGVEGGGVFLVVLEPFDKQPVCFDPHVSGPRGGREKAHVSREILDGAPQQQFGKFGGELGHRADRKIRIRPAGHEVDETLADRPLDHPHALGHAGDRPVGVEDVGFPTAFLDDLNELDGLPEGHRPDLPVCRLAAVEREIDIDDLVHDHLAPLIYLLRIGEVNKCTAL